MITFTLVKLCRSAKLRPLMAIKIAFAIFFSAFCSFSGAWEYDENGAPKPQMYNYEVKFLSLSEHWSNISPSSWHTSTYQPLMLNTTPESQLASAAKLLKSILIGRIAPQVELECGGKSAGPVLNQ